MTKQERQAKLRKMWGKASIKELAEELGVSLRTIQRDVKEMGLTPVPDTTAEELLGDFRQKTEIRRKRKDVRTLTKRLDELERELEAALRIKGHADRHTIAPHQGDDSAAVAVAVASDWHIGEMVHGWQVNGINEFNEAVCRKRVDRFFIHVAKLIRQHQAHTTIRTLVLALLGDFISGGIHDELMESNRLLPIDEILECQEYIVGGILYLLNETDVDLVIPCHSGNHGRMTAKRRISTEAGNSLERMMYHAIARRFEKEPRVKFVITSGYHSYVEIWPGYTVRFHHGHSIR